MDPRPLIERLASDAPGDAVDEALGRLPIPAPGADPDDPRVGLFFLLRMAARSRRRRSAPLAPLAPARLARFEAALAERPGRDDTHGQLHVDAESALRRADVVRALAVGGPILAVGDDDAVTVALALDGAEEVHAIDIDERVLGFLAAHGVRTEVVDVLGSSVPPALRRRFAAVVTDPFRDLDGGLGFLTFAAACLRPEPPAHLAWVDHPDWNFEHDEVRASMEALGFTVRAVHEDLHAYPLPAEIADPDGVAAALGLDPAPLRALTAEARAWSHLVVLARAR